MRNLLLMNRQRPAPPESGAYAPEARIQWWYFDAKLDNGWRLLTFFLPRGLGITDGHPPEHPMVEIVLRSPEGERFHERRFFLPRDLDAKTRSMDASFGEECGISHDPVSGGYRLRARAGGLGYDLVLQPELGPWSPLSKTGFANRAFFMLDRRDLFTRDYFHYAPFVPRGRLSGEIHVNGKTLDAAGCAYHEQGRMNFDLDKMLPVWFWMHVEKPPWTIISGACQPPAGFPGNRPRGGYGYIARGNKPLMGAFDLTGLAVQWTRIRHDFPQKKGDLGLAWEAEARFHRPGLLVRVRLDSEDVLDYLPFEYGRPVRQQPYWAQTVARTRVDIRHGLKKESFSCEGILETMVTGQ